MGALPVIPVQDFQVVDERGDHDLSLAIPGRRGGQGKEARGDEDEKACLRPLASPFRRQPTLQVTPVAQNMLQKQTRESCLVLCWHRYSHRCWHRVKEATRRWGQEASC